MAVEAEYEDKVSLVYSMKEKNIQEWKKHSNEDLKKSSLKDFLSHPIPSKKIARITKSYEKKE